MFSYSDVTNPYHHWTQILSQVLMWTIKYMKMPRMSILTVPHGNKAKTCGGSKILLCLYTIELACQCMDPGRRYRSPSPKPLAIVRTLVLLVPCPQGDRTGPGDDCGEVSERNPGHLESGNLVWWMKSQSLLSSSPFPYRYSQKPSPEPRCPDDWMCRGIRRHRENGFPPHMGSTALD